MGNVPKLRFPRFSGEWEEKKLNELVSYIKGYAFKSENYGLCGTRIIRVSDLNENGIKSDNEKVYIKEDFDYQKYLINKNSIVITTVGSHPDMKESAVGRAIYISDKNIGLLNQNMLMIEEKLNFNNKFLVSLFSKSRYNSFIKSIKRGNANQSNITVKELFAYRIYIPLKKEQEKIASFLSALDKKIEKLEEKIALQEKYKKAMMQKLFSQEIRFKIDDGSDFPAWEEKKLKEVATINPKTDVLPNEFIYIDLESVKKGILVKNEKINLCVFSHFIPVKHFFSRESRRNYL